jgi:hypothetical protein
VRKASRSLVFLLLIVMSLSSVGYAFGEEVDNVNEIDNVNEVDNVNEIESVNVSFIDLSVEHWAYKDIMSLNEKEIIKGYEDNSFRASNTITIPEFLIMLNRSFDSIDNNYVMPTTSDIDITGVPGWSYFDVNSVVNKMPQNFKLDFDIYNLNRTITREEVAYFIANSLNFTNKVFSATNDEVYSDLGPESYFREIKVLKDNGVTNGYEDGTFKPNKSITRAEVSTLINKLFSSEYRTLE